MLDSQISRRRFLQSTGLLAGGLAASPAWSLAPLDRREKGYRRLVVIELHGGNDGLNFMAPTGDDIYHRVRPYLSIGAKGGHKLDDHYRWHPSLANLARRFAEGGCCAIQGVGTRPRNLSHFRSRDVWYMGGHTIPDKELSWLGRLADQQWGLKRSPVSLLTVGPNLSPRALQSELGRSFCYGQDFEATAANAPSFQGLKPKTSELLKRLNQSTSIARQASEALASIPTLDTSVEWPEQGLGRDLSRVAAAIDHGLPTRAFWVTQGGYDTHSYQGENHALLMQELDLALHAFVTELENRDLLKDTLIMTMSEFGRRVAENGVRKGAGTDHGVASIQLLLGGDVKGGLMGPHPDLANLDEDGNFQHTFDFKQINSSVASHWFGAKTDNLFDGAVQDLSLFSKGAASK